MARNTSWKTGKIYIDNVKSIMYFLKESVDVGISDII